MKTALGFNAPFFITKPDITNYLVTSKRVFKLANAILLTIIKKLLLTKMIKWKLIKVKSQLISTLRTIKNVLYLTPSY